MLSRDPITKNQLFQPQEFTIYAFKTNARQWFLHFIYIYIIYIYIYIYIIYIYTYIYIYIIYIYLNMPFAIDQSVLMMTYIKN